MRKELYVHIQVAKQCLESKKTKESSVDIREHYVCQFSTTKTIVFVENWHK